MLNDLLSIGTILPSRNNLAGRADTRPITKANGLDAASSAPVPDVHPTGAAVPPSVALDRAIREAARAMFPDREVDVTSFRDEGSNRIVCRVADRQTGRVLVQSPPDALLRFYASARQALAEPLVALEA
ncbi:MAG: hypothetical protein ACJ8H8_06850 [Geminicoccaceae bacterium]